MSFGILGTLPGVASLKRVTPASKMLPAEIFFMYSRLIQTHLYLQREQLSNCNARPFLVSNLTNTGVVA